MTTLIIDNYDSFTFNLYQLVGEITGKEPIIIKNDGIEYEDLIRLDFDSLIISPGPGRPERERDFGLSRRAILELPVPILGVCLGHQGICYLFGGHIRHAPEPVHGQLSFVYHDMSGLFAGVPSPFRAVRYHSLVCAEPLPSCLKTMAWTEDGIIMGLSHRTRPIWGVQFHPESISTEYGRTLLKNFIQLAARHKPLHSSVSALAPRRLSNASEPSGTVPEIKGVIGDQKLFVRREAVRGDMTHLFTTLFADEDAAFWLDSSILSVGDARFSIMGGTTGEGEIIRYYAHERKLVVQRGQSIEVSYRDLFSYLKSEISRRAMPTVNLPCDFNCGYVGYFGYELKAACGAGLVYHSDHPDCVLLFVDRCVVIDHKEDEVYLLYLGRESDGQLASNWFDLITSRLHASNSEPPPIPVYEPHHFEATQSRELYLQHINACLKYIIDGESYEVCLTNRLKARTCVNPLDFYKVLRTLNPAPYSAYLKLPEVAVACSSPERFLRIRPDGVVETKPIKGTIRRGINRKEDEELRQSLVHDLKNRAENLMIVDLLRNDLGTVCEFGTISVPNLMSVETYATLHQLVSTITGRLRSGQSAVDCLRAAFPGGSMTGAPKLRTMEIIDELECEARGIYSGSIGYLALNGSSDLNIVIRTAVFSNQKVSIGIGGAIVALSDPMEEWEEIILKAKALLKAFEQLSKAPVGLRY
jgi:para-aminobenzoate synthetase